MDILLKIFGVLALVLLGATFLIVVLVVWKWKTIKLILRSTRANPATIDLIADAAPKWTRSSRARQMISELESLGFILEGCFVLEGIPGVRLAGFQNDSRGIRACAYNHDTAGHWIDLYATLADGTELTVSNAPAGSQIHARPGVEKKFIDTTDAADLVAAFDANSQGREPAPLAAGGFKNSFVDAYARDMAWRNSRQGLSVEEFRDVVAAERKTYTEEQLTQAFKEMKLAELRRWSEEAEQSFARSASIPVSQWKQFEDQMIIFRDEFHPAAYVEYLGDTIDLEEDAQVDYRSALEQGITLRQLLERISADTGAEFVRLGEIESPLKAEVYGVKLAVTP